MSKTSGYNLDLRRPKAMLIAISSAVIYGGPLAAQTAKLEIRVIPAAAGFTVCVGTTANRGLYGTEVTTATGIARNAFERLTAGQTVVVTVSKTGFRGVESSVNLRPGRNNEVEVSPVTGTGGPTCGAASSVPQVAPPPPAPPPPTAPVATTLQASTVTSQTGVTGAPVPVAPAVIVRDQNNSAMIGVTVVFVVVSGGGSISPASSVSGTDGIARLTSWTLGPAAGANSIVAKVTGLQAVSFSATAAAPPSGNAQPITITVPANITVPATSTAGARVTYSAQAHDSDPFRTANLICIPFSGSVFPIGQTTVRCSATDPAGNSASASFVVTVLAPVAAAQPPRATTLEAVSATTQTSIAGRQASSNPVVRIKDQNGTVMANVTVAFAVTSGGGSASPASAATGGDGTARLTSWVLGNDFVANTVTASVGNLTPVVFTANGVSAPTTVAAASPAQFTYSAGVAVPQAPAVVVRDQHGSVLSGVPVSFAVTTGGGSISQSTVSTGSDGIARITSWTLGANSGINKLVATVANLSPVEFIVTTPFTLVANVKSANGLAIQNAQICVGSRSDIDQYATVKSGGLKGQVIFTLPAASEYSATGSKGAYIGQTVYQTASGSNAVVTMTLAPGNGGPMCPGAAIEADATTQVSVPLNPLPDLTASVRQSSSPVIGGTKQTYAVKVYNRGNLSASGITLRNSISSNLDYISTSADHGFGCTYSALTVNCSSGSLAQGDSATVNIVTWLSSSATSGHDISFGAVVDPGNTINEVTETNNQAAAAAVSQAGPDRLGDETLPPRGTPGSDLTALDCRQFGNSFVMVGIRGNSGDAIHQIQAACSPMKAGVLLALVNYTKLFNNDVGPTRFDRQCPTGFAVSGMTATVHRDSRQLRSLAVRCSRVTPAGLTSGTTVTLAPAGTPTTLSVGPDFCTQSRAAAGISAASELLTPGAPVISGLLSPFIVTEARMVCSQPVVP